MIEYGMWTWCAEFLAGAALCAVVFWLFGRTPETTRAEYSLGLSPVPFELGRASKSGISRSAGIAFRGTKITTNAPCHGFAVIHYLAFDGVSALIGAMDAWAFNPCSAPGFDLDLPSLRPGSRVEMEVEYTGRVPADMPASMPFTFCLVVSGTGEHTRMVRNAERLGRRLRSAWWRTKHAVRDRLRLKPTDDDWYDE